MENYIVINGKKAELTEEQLEKLGIKQERNNPFDRVNAREDYFIPEEDGTVTSVVEASNNIDDWCYDNAAYFNDEEFAEQMSLKWLLSRKLEKYAWDNKAEDKEWNNINCHYLIFYSCHNSFDVQALTFCKYHNAVYFSDKKVAENAIEDVIKPFMEEHPNFKW